MFQERWSFRCIANQLVVQCTTALWVIQRLRETWLFSRRPGWGQARVTTSQNDRFLKLQVLRKRQATATSIKTLVAHYRDIHIWPSTVSRRQSEGRPWSRRPAAGLRSTTALRIERLRFAQVHRYWNLDDCKRVLFTTETRVALYTPDGRQQVWRRYVHHYSLYCISEREA